MPVWGWLASPSFASSGRQAGRPCTPLGEGLPAHCDESSEPPALAPLSRPSLSLPRRPLCLSVFCLTAGRCRGLGLSTPKAGRGEQSRAEQNKARAVASPLYTLPHHGTTSATTPPLPVESTRPALSPAHPPSTLLWARPPSLALLDDSLSHGRRMLADSLLLLHVAGRWPSVRLPFSTFRHSDPRPCSAPLGGSSSSSGSGGGGPRVSTHARHLRPARARGKTRQGRKGGAAAGVPGLRGCGAAVWSRGWV